MSRARILAGALGALATVIVALPLTRLFDESAWLASAVLGVLLVAAVGMVGRALTGLTWPVIAGQALTAGLFVLLTRFGDTTTWLVVPTPDTASSVIEHVEQAYATVTEYAAPAPTTPGVAVVLISIVLVVGLAVDLSTATAASPSIAGLPLLSLFLVSAANSGGALPWGWFVAAALVWMVMVIHQSEVDLRTWATSVPLLARGEGEDVAGRSHTWQAVRLGALALVVALVVPAVAPHMPTRYVLDGLGRSAGDGIGTGEGMRLSTELDLRRSLQSPSEDPVLRYTTNDPTPGPLRVAVVEDFEDGFGRMRATSREPQEGFTPEDPLDGVNPDVPRDERRIRVVENLVVAPQLAVPTRTTGADTGGIPWVQGDDGTARVASTPDQYSVEYTGLDPRAADFGDAHASGPVDPDAASSRYLALDPGSADRIRELAERLASDDGDPLATAQAIQAHLRGPEFTYDLDIPDPPGSPDDPILSFLETKVGYCQQFAATMTLLARASGIPARTAVGFLPGDQDAQEWVVRASDAHTWPELYFEGVGWVRFEPTPGARATSIPDYSVDTGDVTAGPTNDTTTSSPSTPSATTTTAPNLDQGTAATGDGGNEGVSGWTWTLIGALVVIGALAIMPLTALLARRRRRHRARDETDRVEHEWQELIARIGDLGVVPPDAATPRQTGEWIVRRAHLSSESERDLDTVVTTLESARYAPPGDPLRDVYEEVDAVVGQVRASRVQTARVRASLWPTAGTNAWRSLGRAVLRRLPGRR